jgi:hypothetical protein
MKCPVCSCTNFYVKDPEDEYETYEIELKDGQVAFDSEDEAAAAPDIQNDTEAFCNKCSWHGKLEELTKEK